MIPVDSLGIQISAEASRASQTLENLVRKLDRVNASLSRAGGSSMAQMATGVSRLASAMNGMNGIKTADFTRLVTNLNKLATINSGTISQASVTINQLVKAMQQLNGVSLGAGAQQIADLAKGISQLGYKSSTQAIQNIPKLAIGMRQLMTILSNAPAVSQNLINMTNALANLSRTGASAGKAATSLSKSINTYSNSANRGIKSSFSLAAAIGKIYATYWMLFRAFRILKKAIDISSNLTEVQNVVDVTFGKYSNLVEKMSETSITDFGMSELSVKQFSSRFQAMGTAMGITQKQVADSSEFLSERGVSAYGDLGESMANVSVNLTKLAADMASFYNLEQKDVADDLASVFTGQTRPLRQYGLDLTEATLREWALKNGLDANIKSMTQAEKTMLRYQYVMANTGAAQGDFSRTVNTWANQTRILKQSFEQLGGVVGGTFINMLKPLVKSLNVVIAKFTQFAVAVSNSLGKIFGWTYEETTGGGLAEDFEDAADYANDVAKGTGDAADNAKKMKSYLSGLDELNVIEPDSGSSSGGSGGGGGAGGLSGAVEDASSGQWVKTETIFEKYESELDTLEKLGDYVGTKLTNALNNIDWNSVYSGASNFGSGLADFLNGLISPDLFGATGKTIAGALNSALYAYGSFVMEFDGENLGASIAEAVNEFFATYDFKQGLINAGLTFQKLIDAITGFIKEIDWYEIESALLEGFKGFIEDFDFVEFAKSLEEFIPAVYESVWEYHFASPIEIVFGLDKDSLSKENIKKSINIVASLFKTGLSEFLKNWKEEGFLGAVSNTLDDFAIVVKAGWQKILDDWKVKEKLEDVKIKVEDFKSKVKQKWNEVVTYWKEKDLLSEVSTTYEDFKENIKERWGKAILYWTSKEGLSQVKTTYESIRTKLKEKWDSAVDFWENSKTALSEVKAKYESIKQKLAEKWFEASSWWDGSRVALSIIKFAYESIKEKIKEKWNEALTWWNENVKLPNLSFNFTMSVSSIKQSLNTMISWINTYIIDNINKLKFKVPEFDFGPFGKYGGQQFGFNITHIKGFEMGGYPDAASLFWAGEHGVPELLGTVGGRTAVAGGAEITGIREAVYSTGQAEVSLLSTAVSLLREIAEKDMSVNIGDREIAKASNRGNAMLGRQLITV